MTNEERETFLDVYSALVGFAVFLLEPPSAMRQHRITIVDDEDGSEKTATYDGTSAAIHYALNRGEALYNRLQDQ